MKKKKKMRENKKGTRQKRNIIKKNVKKNTQKNRDKTKKEKKNLIKKPSRCFLNQKKLGRKP